MTFEKHADVVVTDDEQTDDTESGVATDDSLVPPAQVSENAAETIIKVARGNVIGNEEQFLLTSFQSVTGFLYDMNRYANVVLTGPSGGGKTHVQGSVLDALPKSIMYGDGEVTDFSDNAPLDDPKWDFAVLAPLDEYDKISKAIREYIKSMAGEDGGYTKMRNTEDSDAEGGYSPDTISSMAVPFQFLFAPEEKQDGLDNELDNRLIKIPVEDNKYIREAIGRKEFGHTEISPQGLDNTYIYDTEAEVNGLKSHIHDLEDTLIDVRDDEGEITGKRGGVHTHSPEWIWYATKPMFDPSSTHTNRVYGMLTNLMRGSAVWNNHTNPTVTTYNEGREQEVEEIVVMPQDVANVLCTQPTLLGTTHMLDERKRDILDAVKAKQGRGSSHGSSIQLIRQHLRENDKTVPSKSVLRRILKEELAEDYYLRVQEEEGERGSDLFEHRSNGKLTPPRVEHLDSVAEEQDGMDISCPWVDPSDPFEGVVDPIRDQPFKETVKMFQNDMSTNDGGVEDRAEVNTMTDAMGGGDDTTTDGNQTLASAAGQHEDDNDIPAPSDPVVEKCIELGYKSLGVGGTVFNVSQDHDIGDPHLLGVVDGSQEVTEDRLTGSVFDPTHELWSREGVDDERVTNRSEAKLHLEEAWRKLEEEGAVEYDDSTDGFVGVSINENAVEHVPMSALPSGGGET